MTDILCKWLNEELNISERITPATFAKEFSSGYLLGEILHRYQLQDDFDQFSPSKSANAKLNNFTRLEPMFHLMGIPFDTTIARDIMTEKHGTVTHLLYQMYIALNNKKNASLTQVAMKTLQPPAHAKLGAIETEIFKETRADMERLKHATSRQVDLDIQTVVKRFHKHQTLMEQMSFKDKLEEAEFLQQQRQKDRQYLLERSRKMRERQAELMAKINATTLYIPKPPPHQTLKALQVQKSLRRKREANETIRAIHEFEQKLKAILPEVEDSDVVDQSVFSQTKEEVKQVNMLQVMPQDEYIGKIRRRLQEDAVAREEREKRRRKVLNDQLNAHQAQEEARWEEMLVNRLLRQSQQERRIVVQLLQARQEKEIMCQNRILREQQYQERRERDFQDALTREAEIAAQNKLEYAQQIKADQELHDQIAAQRAELRYRRHYEMCAGIVNDIVDFTGKVTEYRELTNNLVPAKLMREWKLLFVQEQPLFEKIETDFNEFFTELILEGERREILDDADFLEYRSMTGEWLPPESCEVKGPPRENPVVSHIIQRLFNIVHTPTPPPPAPEFPAFPIRACVLGKAFSGKSTCLKRLAEEHNLCILDPEILVQEAVEAFKNGELEVADQGVQVDMSEQMDSVTSVEHTPSLHESENTSEPEKSEVASELTGTPHIPTSASVTKTESMLQSQSPTERKQSKHVQPQLTKRAELGSKAMASLKKGLPVADQVVVEILTEAIRNIPEGTGWILDGYPRNYNQAKLLEKALSGCDASAVEQAHKEFQELHKNSLVPYPKASREALPARSGIDVVILFDIRDELCLKRAAGRYAQVQAEKTFHEEFEPPPEGSATGVGNVEKVQPVSDPYYDKEQIQTRITGFLNHWPKVQKWFLKYGNLKTVDASLEKEAVFQETEKILEDTIDKIDEQEQHVEIFTEVKQEEEKEAPGGPPEAVPSEIPAAETPAPGGPEHRLSRISRTSSVKEGTQDDSRGSKETRPSVKSATDVVGSSSKVSSEKHVAEEIVGTPKKQEADVEFDVLISVKLDKGSARASSSPKDKKSRSPKGKKSDAGSPKRKGSRGSTASDKRKSQPFKIPQVESHPELELQSGPPPPKPGECEWIFVDLDIDFELAKVLMHHWEELEKTYVNNLKIVFHNIRDERENIFRYYYQIKKDFFQYLLKPDCKQEYVTQWQKTYNEVTDDLRDDEEVKAELHQQVDDLVDRLWSICDERKEAAENERLSIMKDGWLSDHLGILTNHYLTVMQAEVDRFQDTVRLLKDYYRGMEGLIPEPPNTDYERVPLVELPFDKPGTGQSDASLVDEEKLTDKVNCIVPTMAPRQPPLNSRSKGEEHTPKSPRHSPKETKSTVVKKKSFEPEVEKLEEQTNEGAVHIVIPLVPRYGSAEKISARESKDKLNVKKGKDEQDSTTHPTDPDKRQIYDGYNFAVGAINDIVLAEMAIKEAEEELERLKEIDKDKERAAKKGGKGVRKPTSPMKKNSKLKEQEESSQQIPGVPVGEQNEEEIKKKEIKARAREELYCGIEEEGQAAKARLEVVYLLTSAVLQDLKNKADDAFIAFFDWIGAKFLKEMDSISQLALLLHNAIELGQKMKNEIILEIDDFILDEDLKVLRTPSPELPPSPVERPMANQFTVNQLRNLYNQFKEIAPTGIISKKAFTEMFASLMSLTHGTEELPELWMQLTPSQIEVLSNSLSPELDYIDWRRFLVALCSQIPALTQADLLHYLSQFKKMDQKQTGLVTREQWYWIPMWFSKEQHVEDSYDRATHLKKLLFEVFADHSGPIPLLDYADFLMYFSVAANYHEGFLRALSVATGKHMPRLDKPELPATVQLRGSQISVVEGAEIKDEGKTTAEPAMSDEVIPPEAEDVEVSVEDLYKVLHHSVIHGGDSHRFSSTADPEDHRSIERLTAVYQELNDDDTTAPIMYRVLIDHPVIQDVVVACKQFKSVLLDQKCPAHNHLNDSVYSAIRNHADSLM